LNLGGFNNKEVLVDLTNGIVDTKPSMRKMQRNTLVVAA
jgi:hypothetical protein